VVEESPASGRQLDAVRAAIDQLNADFLFEVADLPAERRLGGMQFALGRNRQTAGIGHGNEVSQLPKHHANLPCLVGIGPAYKVFVTPTSGLY
jgi:hypothetical protein